MKRTDLQSPCKDCAERHDLCHSECERYQQYSANRKELSKWQRDLSKADSMDATRGERIHRKMRRKLGGINK